METKVAKVPMEEDKEEMSKKQRLLEVIADKENNEEDNFMNIASFKSITKSCIFEFCEII